MNNFDFPSAKVMRNYTIALLTKKCCDELNTILIEMRNSQDCCIKVSTISAAAISFLELKGYQVQGCYNVSDAEKYWIISW